MLSGELLPDWTLEKRDPISGIKCPEWNSDRVGLKYWDDPTIDDYDS